MSAVQGVNSYAPPLKPQAVVAAEAHEKPRQERTEVAPEPGERQAVQATNPNLGTKFSAIA